MIFRHHETRELPDWLCEVPGLHRREILPTGIEVLTADPSWHCAGEDATWTDLGEGWQAWRPEGDMPRLRAQQVDDQGVMRCRAIDGTWLPVLPVQGLRGESWCVPVVRDRGGRILLEQPWAVDAETGAPARRPTLWQTRLIQATEALAEMVGQADLAAASMEVDLVAIGLVLGAIYALPPGGFLALGLLDDRLLGRAARISCGCDPAVPRLR